MSEKIKRGGELAELLPDAIELEDLIIEVIQGEEAEVAAVKLGDDVGRRWLYVPVSPDEMREVDPEALTPVRDYPRQRAAPGTLAARQGLVLRLLKALMRAQQELAWLDGFAATDMPDVEARLPAKLRKCFWRLEPREALDAIEAAFDAADAAGFEIPGIGPSGGARPRPRLVVNNDNDS